MNKEPVRCAAARAAVGGEEGAGHHAGHVVENNEGVAAGVAPVLRDRQRGAQRAVLLPQGRACSRKTHGDTARATSSAGAARKQSVLDCLVHCHLWAAAACTLVCRGEARPVLCCRPTFRRCYDRRVRKSAARLQAGQRSLLCFCRLPH